MRILGIETSCDETAVAVVEVFPQNLNNDGKRPAPSHFGGSRTALSVKVLSNTISSQVRLHAKYGGVVPNLAAREHVKNIEHVFNVALNPVRSREGSQRASASNGMKDIDLIAVTRGPGLGPALLVGITFAKTLAWKYDKPLIGVNHLEGHIYSNWLKPIREFSILNFQFSKEESPILNLIVSGGHTELVLMEGHGRYKLIGETLDDAVGEAFDKVARLLELGYPGGPIVAKMATKLKIKNEKLKIEFPRPMTKSKDYNFSYSGLKTAVLYKIRDLEKEDITITENIKNEICYEFQKAATEVLIQKTIKAAKEYGVKSVFLSGGVSANQLLRSDLARAVEELGINYSQPELEYTGDNAAMIALIGYFNQFKISTDWKSVEMDANLGF